MLPKNRPAIMGILNVTPDSFSDGGSYLDPDAAVARALQMRDDGADLIDIGGESTRPGAAPVTAEEEIRRVIPVISSLGKQDVLISIDTSKTEVAREALNAGASIVNDVCGFRNPDLLSLAASKAKAVCIMHMQGEPRTMQDTPVYQDVVGEVEAFLLAQAKHFEGLGMSSEQIWIDPGIGFGKTTSHNFALLSNVRRLAAHGYPVLIGASRKSLIAKVSTNEPPAERLPGSIAIAIVSALKGARILRVHDVRETVQALKVAVAMTDCQP